jgi:predicted HAD superfamily hydrolase
MFFINNDDTALSFFPDFLFPRFSSNVTRRRLRGKKKRSALKKIKIKNKNA